MAGLGLETEFPFDNDEGCEAARTPKEVAQAEKQRIVSELLAKADEARKRLDYSQEQRMRDAASLAAAV